MIRHIWSVLCSQTVTDAQTNNVSLFNVIEQLAVTLKEIPEGAVTLLPMPLELVTLWERDESAEVTRGQALVDIFDGTGKRLGVSTMVVEVSKLRRCRSKWEFNGIPVTTSGRYVVRVTLQEDGEDHSRVVAEIPIEVTVSRLPGGAESHEAALSAPSEAWAPISRTIIPG